MRHMFIYLIVFSLFSMVTVGQDTNQQQAEEQYYLGNQLYNDGNYDDALIAYQDGLKIVQELDVPMLERGLLREMGNTYRALDEYQQAYDAYLEALAIAQSLEDWLAVGNILNMLGSLSTDQGKTDQAFEYYHQSVDIYTTHIHAPYYLGTTLANIGWLHRQLGNFEEALDFFLMSLPVSQRAGDYMEQNKTLHNLGDLYSHFEQNEEALNYFSQSLEISLKIGDHGSEGANLNDMGLICEALHQHQLALAYYNAALKQHQLTGDQQDEAMTRDNIDLLLQKLDHPPEKTAPEPLCQPLTDDAIPTVEPLNAISFTIINDSETPICYVYLAEVDSFELGQDQLGIRESIPAFTEHQLTVESGVYDLTLVDCSGNAMDFYRSYDMTQSTTVTYQFDHERVRPLVDAAGANLNSNPHLALANYRTVLAIVQQTYRTSDVSGFEGILHGQISWMYIGTGDFDQSEKHALLALERLNTVENPDSHGTFAISGSHAALGMIYTLQGRFDEAIQSFDSALGYADFVTRVYLTNIKAMVLQLTGKNKRAISLLEDLPQISDDDSTDFTGDVIQSTMCNLLRVQGNYNQESCDEVLGDDPYVQAFNKLVHGGIQLESGQYADALETFDQVIEIYELLDNRVAMAEVLNAKGATHFFLGQYQQALDTFDQALAIAEQYDLLFTKEQILGNKASVVDTTGNIGEALYLYNQALDLSRELGVPSDEAAILMNLGRINHIFGRYELSNEHYMQALDIATELGEEARQASILSNHGLLFVTLEDFDKAFEKFNTALEIQLRIGDRDGEGYTRSHIADLYRLRNEFALAQEWYIEAFSIHEEAGNQAVYIAIINSIGRVYAELEDYPTAINKMTQAVELAEKLNFPYLQNILLTDRGIVYELSGQPDLALADYIEATQVSETLLQNVAIDSAIEGIQGQRNREEVFPFNQSASQRLVALLASRGELESAFHYAEYRRAILTRSELTGDAIHFRAGLDQSLLDREVELRHKIQGAQAFLDTLLQNGGADDEITTAREQLETVQRDYDHHIETMQLQGGYLAREISFQTASLEQIQSVIPDDTTLLIYSIASQIPSNVDLSESVVFLLTQDTLDAVILDVTDTEISDRVRAFAIGRRTGNVVLGDLYDMIIAPIADKVSTSKLIISPDQSLNYVPFAALFTEESGERRYLIDDYSLRMIPSGTTLWLLSQREKSDANLNGLVLSQDHAPGLPPLPNAFIEALKISQVLGVDPIRDATETQLRETVAGNNILHISAHAELNRFAPLYSVIHLVGDNVNDGRLEVREIFELDLSQGTELVILSGCETGSGGDGEDFGLMNRAFLVAGAQEVVSSLWVVDDSATADLLVSFMENREIYYDSAEALRQAMLATREEYPEPYLWASFVINGLES